MTSYQLEILRANRERAVQRLIDDANADAQWLRGYIAGIDWAIKTLEKKDDANV